MSHESPEIMDTDSSFSEPKTDSADDYKPPKHHSSDSDNSTTDIPSTVLLTSQKRKRRKLKTKCTDHKKQPPEKKKKIAVNVKLRHKNEIFKLKPKKKIKPNRNISVYNMPKSKYDRAMKLLLAEGNEDKPLSLGKKRILETCQRPLINSSSQSSRVFHLNPFMLSRKLPELSTCLLNKDWSNLAKLISVLAKDVRKQWERVLLMKVS